MSGAAAAGNTHKGRLPPLMVAALGSPIFVGVGLMLWCSYGAPNFYASPDCFRTMVWPAALLAVAFSVLTLYAIGLRSEQTPDAAGAGGALRQHPTGWWSQAKIVCQVVLGGLLVVGFVFFWPISMGVPSLIHRTVGEPFQASYTVANKQLRSGRGGRKCNRIDVHELRDFWYGEICVDDAAFAALQPADTLTVHGTRSWWGVELNRYAYAVQPR